jgi:two-component system chemotaxis sensor kinase CheA
VDEDSLDFAAFLPDFLVEADEHLDRVDALLLEAERRAEACENLTDEMINDLFRSVHTLKGMAGMMGLAAYAELTHAMEHLLGQAREGTQLGLADWKNLTLGHEALRGLSNSLRETGQEGAAEVALAAVITGALAVSSSSQQPATAAVVPPATQPVAGPAIAQPPVLVQTPPQNKGSAAAASERVTSIRVETARVDQLLEIVGELVVHLTRAARLADQLADETTGEQTCAAALVTPLVETMQAIKRVSDDLQDCTLRVRMVPIGQLFGRFGRIVRDVAHECGKQTRLDLRGADTELDKAVIEQIGDPLIHLVRNAVDHGLETPAQRLAAGKPVEGVVTLSAQQNGPWIVITVSDDGGGIDRERVLAKARGLGWFDDATPTDAELFAVLFRPGFSTAKAVTSISGRGVGLDVVQSNIQRLGGSIQVHAELGRGTRFAIKLPLTLVSAKALLVRAGERIWAIPLAVVVETLKMRPDDLRTLQGREVLQARGQLWPIVRLERWQDGTITDPSLERPVVVVTDGERPFALVVDEFVGQQDVVMKPLGDFLGAVRGVGGATILGDGRVALILDVASLPIDAEAGPVGSRA